MHNSRLVAINYFSFRFTRYAALKSLFECEAMVLEKTV